MSLLRIISARHFPAIICLVVAVFVLMTPVLSQQLSAKTTVGNSMSVKPDKEIPAVSVSSRQATKENTAKEVYPDKLRCWVVTCKITSADLRASIKSIPVHGSIRFLHMLKLF